jgi:serine phosphatase RsbU (regulator of sigma subunit)
MRRGRFGGIMTTFEVNPSRGSGLRRRRGVSTEANKATFRRYVEEVTNRGNFGLADEIFDRYLAHQPDGSTLERSSEDAKRFQAEFRSAIPDLHATIQDQIAEGDKVVTRWKIRGTLQGEFRGIAPTGEDLELNGIVIFRFSPEGKVVESWDSYDQLGLMRRGIEQELRVARRIQQALLPEDLPRPDGWEVTARYRPARKVGGDFYDFLELEDGRLGLVVGDATGHGVPAALMMANTQSVLRAVAQKEGSAPGRALAEANEVLFTYIPPNTFITCFYGVLDPKSGRLRYANAGHSLPFRRRLYGDAEELMARGMPLGLMPAMGYEEHETVLAPGEGVLFYTDGLIEAHNPQGEMFGSVRLRSVLEEEEEGHGGDGKALSAFMVEELERFVGEGGEQEDDITLVTLRRSAT